MSDVPLDWMRELHGFQWLRHLDAAAGAVNASNAQVLISDWINACPKPGRSSGSAKMSRVVWDEEVTGRRLISWIQHSVSIVEQATPPFYRAWLRSIGLHIRYLRRNAGEAADGMPSLISHIALAYAHVCVSGQTRYLRNAFRNLDSELERQILPDGGPITRNPAHILEILALLLPLRQACERQGIMPGEGIAPAIDRMMAGLKFFRMGDGSTARFNGVSAVRPELVATILYYDDALGSPPSNAPHCGFQRLEGGDTVIVADTGMPAPGSLSADAHAGTLSFELSSGSSAVIVNCGAPVSGNPALAAIARSTAAHTTATLGNTSSSRVYQGGLFSGLIGGWIISGPSRVACSRTDGEDGSQFEASHNGYLQEFGLIHHRSLRLAQDGRRVEGIDRFLGPSGNQSKTGNADFAIRFHLHPSVSAGLAEDRRSVLLMCGGGIAWRFTCIDCMPELEESIFLASSSGQRRSRQIVLSGTADNTSEVRWLMERQF